MNYAQMIIPFIGGLALFIYGMSIMAQGLQNAAGSKMKSILEALTQNKLMGIALGALVTAIVQSSSATTVMVVGFVNAGLMNLTQAMSVIMGANIGTTVTGWLVSSSEWAKMFSPATIAPLAVMLGVILMMSGKNARRKEIASIVIGFGVLFIGIESMSSSVEPLRDSEAFRSMFVTLGTNPLLGIFAGAFVTAIIQSSSASQGILLSLAASGLVPFNAAVYIIMGQNIGTCITAVLASVGTNRNAKRTTAIHLMFNVVGTVIFVVLCMVTPFVDWMIATNPANPAAQIANVHTIFNIATTVILFPFGPMLVNIAKKILPDTQVKHVMDADQWFEGLMASKHHLGVSTIAISQIHEEIRDMLAMAAANVSDSFKAMEQGPGENGIQEITDREEEIDLSNVRLSKKISKVLVLDQTPQDIEALNKMYSILGNIERIGDHAMNLAEYAQTIQEKNLNFSDYAKNEFKVMDESCAEGMELLRMAAAGDSGFTLEKIKAIEQKIDDITDNFRQNQIDRMREGHCNVESSILYSEMLTDYERIGDHMLNIGEAYDVIQWNNDKEAVPAAENML